MGLHSEQAALLAASHCCQHASQSSGIQSNAFDVGIDDGQRDGLFLQFLTVHLTKALMKDSDISQRKWLLGACNSCCFAFQDCLFHFLQHFSFSMD